MPDYVKDVELKINVSLPLRKTAWRHFFFFFSDSYQSTRVKSVSFYFLQ